MYNKRSLLLTIPAIFFSFQTQKNNSSGRPNIIFIFSDDHATHAIGAYGPKNNNPELYKYVVTPSLDRLAAKECFLQMPSAQIQFAAQAQAGNPKQVIRQL